VAASESRIEYRIARPRADSADWDAPLTVEGVKLQENTAKASRRKCEFDQMREVPFVRKADDLALARSHLAQFSSASRFGHPDPVIREKSQFRAQHDSLSLSPRS
jgi:hypothetical protein